MESEVRRDKDKGWTWFKGQGPGWFWSDCPRTSPLPPRAGKVLGNLQLNLLSKSKVYEDPALSAIFLHNNYNYILKALEK